MRRFRADMENTKVRSSLGCWGISLTFKGTWVPLEQGEALAQRNNIYEKLRTIFEYIPGNTSPPPAPKHTTAKPKLPKKPAVPKWGNSESRGSLFLKTALTAKNQWLHPLVGWMMIMRT